VAPTSILALTFSNKAAEEMRARVTKAYPAEAPQIWMGTFHAFGLELLRKFGMKLGLPSRVDVLDPVDALFLLEQELASLALEHYQNLYEPTMYLPAILAAISRAKDELVTPAQYTHLAGEMKSRAQTPDELVAAEKALEVARAYEIYQGNLEQKGLLDFGDLISRSVILLKQHPDIRDLVQKSYSHVLVDEYQDVNRASAVFLQQIAGEGEGLWVVGDVRQAIYRFRGAAPGNMKRFAGDFPGAKFRALERNYRSQPAIIDTFAGLAPQMIASTGHPFTPWTPTRRQEDGGVFLEIAEDDIAEGDGLAREIIRRHKEGLSYRDQAVLCRSHSGLAKIAEALERAGVPAFYLGDVFERPEIRDLLSVLSLTHQGDGRGLVRVAGFPEYQIPLEDVKVLRTAARAQDTPFPRALELAQTLPTLSEKGREGLARLARHLAGIDYPTSPWRALALYLFDRSSYLRSLLREESAGAQQQRLALYQLLQIAHEHKRVLPEPGVDPKRAFLRYIRRLTFFGADTQLRQIPEWAAGIDAVRLLTVHASKGLEFKAVYVPHLAPTRFPANRQSRECPPPDGMIATPEENEHEEEEECLFFVALSRARDYLCLSRAKRYGRRNSNPSRFLSLIAARLPRNPNGDVTWAAGSRPAPPAAPALPLCPANVEPVFTLRSLESYMRCPRQFYYEAYLGLSGRREDTAYMRFHGCVYSVLHWMQDQQAAGLVVDEAEAQTRLAERWEAEKMKDHPYEAIYLRKAKEMISQALKRPHPVGSVRIELEVKREQGSIRFTPDSLEVTGQESEKTVVARRIRTGKPTKSEPEKEVYALYQEGARRAYPGASVTVEIDYLSTGEVVDASVSGKKLTNRLEKYDAAMVGIREKNFAPAPDDHTCPRCPHYFLCPAPDPR
jgi:superfamily I DNA/RNA helicase